MQRRATTALAIAGIAGLVALALTVTAVATVTPPSVSATLAPGQSMTVTKTVDVPTVPPKLDFVLDVDLSGSYGDDLPNIKALTPGIASAILAGVPDAMFGLVTFVDFPFGSWGSPGWGDYAYARNQDLTASTATWQTAVNAMFTRNGVDGPESQYESLYQAATGAGRDANSDGDFTDVGDIAPGLGVSFRPDATKVIAITTDAPFHEAGDGGGPFPYPGASGAATIAALNAAGIKVIALKAPGSGAAMDALAAATGGSVQTTTASSNDIADAILDALEELTFTVTANAVGCSPNLDVTFAPPSYTNVAGGTTLSFAETISVPASTPGGDYACTVEFLADDTVIGTQTINIRVNTAPDCSVATAGGDIWPPNGKYVSRAISGLTDADGDTVAVSITGITQDEPVDAIGDGDTAPDAVIGSGPNFEVRAERAGTGDGRVYRVSFTGDDGNGGTCSGTVLLGVPHDQSGPAAVDSGGIFNSLVP